MFSKNFNNYIIAASAITLITTGSGHAEGSRDNSEVEKSIGVERVIDFFDEVKEKYKITVDDVVAGLNKHDADGNNEINGEELQTINETKGELSSLMLEFQIDSLSPEDKQLFTEYLTKLKDKSPLMQEFALKLVESGQEFINNFVDSKLLERYDSPEKKYSMSERSWKSIVKQILRGKANTGYKLLPENAENLTAFIVDNKDQLIIANNDLSTPIDLINQHLDIATKRSNIEGLRSDAAKYRQISSNFKKLTGEK